MMISIDKYKIAEQLADTDLNTMEQILKTTGIKIFPTHKHGSKAICRVFTAISVKCNVAEVLQRSSGIKEYLVLMLDICYRSILGGPNPRVVSPPGRFLRSSVYTYKSEYNKVLEQLVNTYRVFDKLTDIMGIPGVAVDEYDVRMSK